MATEVSYIDYETFLSPTFSPAHFANQLVLATNDPTDTSLDLSTPLSRVLFDVQEVDTHIDNLTTKSAVPLLEHTQDCTNAATHLLSKLEEQVASLTESYQNLEQNVIVRYEAAELVRLAADRLCQTVKLGRSVLRTLQAARQLELLMDDVAAAKQANRGGVQRNHAASMVPAAQLLLSLQASFDLTAPGEENAGLDQVALVTSLRSNTVTSAERALLSRAQQLVRDFAVSATSGPAVTSTISSLSGQMTTFAQQHDMQLKTSSACEVLYLLSPVKSSSSSFEPTLLLSALQSYLQSALTSSLSSLARALAALPTLERTLLDVSARCQNIVALEALLGSTQTPDHPLFSRPKTPDQPGMVQSVQEQSRQNLLQPLLASLDTPSLPSFFWRSLASSLSSRVREILTRGGVSARTLRSSKDRVAQAVRECVQRGSQGTGADGDALRAPTSKVTGSWEREAAVMVGSISGVLTGR